MEENFLLLFRFDNPLDSSVEFMKLWCVIIIINIIIIINVIIIINTNIIKWAVHILRHSRAPPRQLC